MESVELVAKNSNREKEKTLTGGEDFSVDDLLDFPNDDVFSENDDEVLQRKKGLSLSLNDENTLHRSNDDISTAGEDLGSLPTSELAVPMHDEQELEWLSNFVEETNKYFDPYAPTAKPVWLTGNRKHPVPPANNDSCVKPPLPVKTRNKRARTVLTDSSSSSTTSSSSSSGRSRSSTLCLSGAEFLHEPIVQRQKKKKKKRQTQSLMLMQAQTQTLDQTQTRKCSHCGVQRTPQWRTGPMGAKTLCNACGVRFKSGRLLPEYRPACSPTFSSELHSNHHRRVVEMRLKKEMSDDADGTGF